MIEENNMQKTGEVKEYNAAENTFLAHDGYLGRMRRKRAGERMLKPHERIRFGVAETELTERGSGSWLLKERSGGQGFV